jgi:hypothetical protein
MTQFISSQESCQELQFPIMLKVMTDIEAKEYHRKKLFELSLKSIGEIPQLDEPNEEQKGWVLFRLSHSNTWSKVHENKIGDSKNWKRSR